MKKLPAVTFINIKFSVSIDLIKFRHVEILFSIGSI